MAAPARQATARGRGLVGLLVPAALLGIGVAGLDGLSSGPRALAWLASFGTPVLAAARRPLLLWAPLAAGLWLVAWLAHGLVAQAAGVVLIAGACLTAADAAARVAPAWSIRAGLVVLAAVDAILVWGTPRVEQATTSLHAVALPHALPSLQDATFGSALMGWLDLLAPALLGVVVTSRTKLGAAAVTGIAAGLWGLLLLTTSEVAATVPVLAGLAFAAFDARRRRL
ncbi:MAG: hypothetical protein JO073_06295 [Actinobacteria bacterium]|nr:hypothetical protein [Actinomycetota bacterium]